MKDLKKIIAQLICIAINPQEICNSPEKKAGLKKYLTEYQWGSVIVFGGEVESTAALIDELQKISEIPLLVASDLESGAGHLFSGATVFPSNMAIGATRNLDFAYKAGKITAQEAKEIGINVIFAPCVDVNSNPENPIINIRSYGEDPGKVTDFAQAFISGCRIEGVMATAKHFPGHGDTFEDSHIKLTTIKKSRKALDKTELYPFKKIIRDDVAAIMTAHIAVPALDKSLRPATLSRPIMTGLLREEFGFAGLIFTDALTMGGVKNDFEASQAVQSVLAGCDILLMPPDPVQALNDLIKAVETNIIPLSVIETANNRVQKYKKIYCLNDYKRDLKKINTEKNKNFARLVAAEALTKIKSSVKLPLITEKMKITHILFDHDNAPFVWDFLPRKLKSNYKIDTIVIGSGVTIESLKEIESIIENTELIIFSYFSRILAWKGTLYPEKYFLNWLEKNIIAKKEVIAVTFSNPYLINKLAVLRDYYCTFSDTNESQDAVISLLFGGLVPKGISPVTL